MAGDQHRCEQRSRACGRAILGDGHSGRPLLQSDEHQPGGTALAGPGSIHSFQRTFFDRALHGDGPARVSSCRRAQDLRQGRLATAGSSGCYQAPGLDTSTGSLGQGLSVGLGFALGARMRGQKFHTFVMLGDGELQEGMVWEALHIAPRYKLGNLTAILDWNGLQQFGWVLAVNEQHRGDRRDPWSGVDLRGVFEKLGWRCIEINGHDYLAGCSGTGKRQGVGRFRSAVDDYCSHDEGQRSALYRRKTRMAFQGRNERRA